MIAMRPSAIKTKFRRSDMPSEFCLEKKPAYSYNVIVTKHDSRGLYFIVAPSLAIVKGGIFMGVLRYKRLLSILCCLVFICSFYGSLTAQAVFGVDDIVIGGALVASAAVLTYITVVGLSGSDLAEPLYEAANRANTNINDFLEPKVTAFLEATDGTTLLDTQIKSLVNGLSYAKNGMLYFSDALGDFIYDFGEWLIDNEYISVDSGNLVVSDSVGLSSVDLIIPFNFILSDNCHWTTSGNVYSWQTSVVTSMVYSNTWVAAYSARFQYKRSSWSNWQDSSLSYTYQGKTVYYIAVGAGSNENLSDTNLPLVGSASSGEIAWAMVYGSSSTGASNGLDVWNQDTTDGFAVDPTGVIGGSIADADVPAGAIAGVGDYVQAIADAIAGIADITLPVAGVGDIAIDPAVPADVAIPVTPAIPADRAEAVPATGDATQPYPATGDYTLPLADFFPFCIPFDLYKILSAFDASPVAPEFDVPIVVQSIGLNVPVHVDLSEWEPAAVIVRNIGFVVFCAALAWATSKLIQK